MTDLMHKLRRSALVGVVLGLSACGGVEAPDSEPGTEALVSSESALTCTTCGSTRYSDYQTGWGFTCTEAYNVARSTLMLNMANDCPLGTCNVTWTRGACSPVGPYRDDGFDGTFSVTYHCCQ
ncbi:hypothetical protein [Myxococcus sp. Y35]|uniref:hypothetical protein n=1 Tax=Pseudomyxococcus flavus TaxID=3115648 RepID=UPI003CE7E4A5